MMEVWVKAPEILLSPTNWWWHLGAEICRSCHL